MSNASIDLDDLSYELRSLLGASEMWRLSNEKSLGNPTNYFMDASFVHSRNLYNFFTNNTSNDGSIIHFGDALLSSTLYSTWREPLHRHTLHINNRRRHPSNTIGGIHLNQMVMQFASDITNLWSQWINQTSSSPLKAQLQTILTQAQKQAADDYLITSKRIDKQS